MVKALLKELWQPEMRVAMKTQTKNKIQSVTKLKTFFKQLETQLIPVSINFF